MMTLSPAVEQALENGYSRAHIVKIELSGNTLYYTDNSFDIEYSGDTFLGNGLLIDLGEPQETAELQVNEVDLGFSAADLSTVSLMLNNNQFNRPVTVKRVYLDDNGQVIGEAIPLVNLLIVGYSLSEKQSGGDSIIILKMASEFAAWEKSRGRRTTPASQQLHFPNDKGMEFAASVQKEQRWGSD